MNVSFLQFCCEILPYRQFGLIMLQPQVATYGYENMSFQDKLRIDLKSLPMYIGIHNRMVIDLRKTASNKRNCL